MRPTLILVLAAIAFGVTSGHLIGADIPTISLKPDHVLKGTTPTISVALDRSIQNQNEIKTVIVGGQAVEVKAPGPDGILSVPLPNLDIQGQAELKVIGKDNQPVAAAELIYVASAAELAPKTPEVPSSKALGLLGAYLLVLCSIPLICMVYDLVKSYAERLLVFKKLRHEATVEEVGNLLAQMDQGPTGLVGLTRGLLALTLLLALSIAAFHLIIFAPVHVPDIAEKLLMMLAGTLTAITGFYFGSKATMDAQQQKQTPKDASKPSSPPRIVSISQGSGAASNELTLVGEGFGQTNTNKAMVAIDTKPVADTDIKAWSDREIKLEIPHQMKGLVHIVVTNDAGTASDPKDVTIV